MAKVAKRTQTDYTKGGKAISDTSIPLYQQALTDISAYNTNTPSYIDDYLKRYFSNTAEQNDFLRNYQTATAKMTGSNAAATGGGYSSLNQRNYDDTQRYYNDLASRLQGQNVGNAAAMAQQYYNNLLNSTSAYNTAYGLGKEYSDVEQYNYMADQVNNPFVQMGNILPAVGTGIGYAFGGPVGGQLGGAIGGAIASPMSVRMGDYSSLGTSYQPGGTGLTQFTKALNQLTGGNYNTANAGNVSSGTVRTFDDVFKPYGPLGG